MLQQEVVFRNTLFLQCKALEYFARNRLDVTGKHISVTTCQNICFTAQAAAFTDLKSANYSQQGIILSPACDWSKLRHIFQIS